MAKIKNLVIDVCELIDAGLSFDQVMECTDYPAELVRQVFERYGYTDMPLPESYDFDDVPF